MDRSVSRCSDLGRTDFLAKQCALIAVNEVINSLKSFAESDDWKQVKEEIEKL